MEYIIYIVIACTTGISATTQPTTELFNHAEADAIWWSSFYEGNPDCRTLDYRVLRIDEYLKERNYNKLMKTNR